MQWSYFKGAIQILVIFAWANLFVSGCCLGLSKLALMFPLHSMQLIAICIELVIQLLVIFHSEFIFHFSSPLINFRSLISIQTGRSMRFNILIFLTFLELTSFHCSACCCIQLKFGWQWFIKYLETVTWNYLIASFQMVFKSNFSEWCQTWHCCYLQLILVKIVISGQVQISIAKNLKFCWHLKNGFHRICFLFPCFISPEYSASIWS